MLKPGLFWMGIIITIVGIFNAYQLTVPALNYNLYRFNKRFIMSSKFYLAN